MRSTPVAMVLLLAACPAGSGGKKGGDDPIVGDWTLVDVAAFSTSGESYEGALHVEPDLTGELTLTTLYTTTTESYSSSTAVTIDADGDSYDVEFTDTSGGMSCTIDGDVLDCQIGGGTVNGEETDYTIDLTFERV